MKTIAILIFAAFSYSTLAIEQDTTSVDLGKSGLVTIVDKGSTNVITIETDSISNIVGALAEDVLKTMSKVMQDMFETLAVTAKEIEQMEIDQNILKEDLKRKSKEENQQEAVEEMKKDLQRAKEEMQLQRQEMQEERAKIQKEYEEQLKKYQQYQAFSKIIEENEEELRKSNGKVTIEVDEPVLQSRSYSIKEDADTTEIKVVGKSILKVIEGDDNTELAIGGYSNIHLSEGNGDTVIIRLGKKVLRIADDVKIEDVETDDIIIDKQLDQNLKKKNNSRSSKTIKFKGHWGLFELGRNMYETPDYSVYGNNDDFMALDYTKSYEVNINPIQFNVGLLGNRRRGTARVGLVSGIGFSWNNYAFDNPVSVMKQNNMLMPYDLTEADFPNLEKTKLTSTYLTVPLLLEFQFPGNNKMHLSAGGIGSLKLESHTKIKFDGDKFKDKGNYYLAPYRYGVTARLGYGNLNVFGTYYVTDVFESGKGPKMLPYTFGIGFAN